MADATARFALPYLAAGQAQKELFHNEALARVDALLHPVAQAIGLDTPPPAPAPGRCWIVGSSPSGDWAGRAAALAIATDGGWRFVAPTAGLTVWLAGDNLFARHDGTGWRTGEVTARSLLIDGRQVVGGRQASIAEPTGGGTVDAGARTAISRIIATLRAHGLVD